MGDADEPPRARSYPVVGALIAGYVGIYLCRKNLAVAVPLLRDAFHATKGEIGRIASVSTLAYALGKLALGPLVDRVGGRAGFLIALAAVAAFGAAGAIVPGLGFLTIAYSLNRFAGAGGWPAMMKLVPTWFAPRSTGTVAAVLSLSYVLGGIAATLLARQVVALGGGWRAVMGFPSLALLAILGACAIFVRSGPLVPRAAPGVAPSPAPIAALLRRPQFLLVCALSFTLTLMRESFNTWSVDFLTSIQAGAHSVTAAALQSTTFDIAGCVSIVGMGVAYDRAPVRVRRWLIASILAALAALLVILPGTAARDPASGAWLIGAVGLLVYGPYSLLAGALAVESGGAELAATASGIIDAVGYCAGILAGELLGRVLDYGGYALGFHGLAAVTAVAAVLALGLQPKAR
ncbi:MAG TPA: MFS transporter [Polyangia bacterium]|nr:MFS transporter [Polyangia bacterium]